MANDFPIVRNVLLAAATVVLSYAAPARAADRLCDPGGEDCRAILLDLIRNERVGIDVAFWFMEDVRYTTALIAKWHEGVPVRVLIDTRAKEKYPLNGVRVQELAAAGIPIRAASTYWLHWKMMLFSGQNTVQFSGANYSTHAWRPETAAPFENYIDEAIFFSDQSAIVDSFRTRFDNAWVHTSHFVDFANITGPITRTYDVHPTNSQLNFPPFQGYRSRAVAAYRAEKQGIDVIMFRITDAAHANEMIAAARRGVRVRLITEQTEYGLLPAMKDNVDRMIAAGVQIRQRAHAGLNHQKSVVLRGQRMIIFGSSNWAPESNGSQYEHNMFTRQSHIYDWFVDQFDRKWFNATGVPETWPFGAPLPPPPTAPEPEPPAASPAPQSPPSPSSSGGCPAPDPFAGLGGGTCFNGGWLPPGMPIPGGGTASAPAPAPAPPRPAPPSACTTPDPFAGLGGGTCFNGGWLPPGMPVPGGLAAPPAVPPPPPPSTGCRTPDPFQALGGGTCFNGGWLPPGMPIPRSGG